MDEGVQAAGAMLYVLSESVKLATDLLVATVKTTGSTGKAVAAMLAAHWKNSTQKEMGEISLKAMVRRNGHRRCREIQAAGKSSGFAV